jgi:hypothetical protein
LNPCASIYRQFRFKHKLISLDATVIDLCAGLFDWARFCRTKGALKLYLLLDDDGFLPCHAVITEGKQHESGCFRATLWRGAPTPSTGSSVSDGSPKASDAVYGRRLRVAYRRRHVIVEQTEGETPKSTPISFIAGAMPVYH